MEGISHQKNHETIKYHMDVFLWERKAVQISKWGIFFPCYFSMRWRCPFIKWSHLADHLSSKVAFPFVDNRSTARRTIQWPSSRGQDTALQAFLSELLKPSPMELNFPQTNSQNLLNFILFSVGFWDMNLSIFSIMSIFSISKGHCKCSQMLLKIF